MKKKTRGISRKKIFIATVRQSKKSKQKTVTIPKSAKHIRKGDYVVIKKG